MKGDEVRISGVILAGGAGKRFGGKAKHNVIVGGRTILYGMLEVIGDIFQEIIIVTAKNSREEFPGYTTVHDEYAGIGPLGGIHAALKQTASDAIFVFAGDMPLIDKDIILQQIKVYSMTRPAMLVPKYGELTEPLHSIYNISILRDLEDFIRNNSNHPVYEFFDIAGAAYFNLDDTEETRNKFLNINTPADVERAERILLHKRRHP
jgi:molybdopterin-guanine dinucleotide biosynthesis protein A